MATRNEAVKSKLIDDVAALVLKKAARAEGGGVETFARQFYANVAPDDIVTTPAEDLAGAALAMWRRMQTRTPGKPTINVYNPRLDQHGWMSPHTAIEIVNDDMPFLVNSVVAELNNHDLAVHLLIHPIVEVARDADGKLVELVPPGSGRDGLRARIGHASRGRRAALGPDDDGDRGGPGEGAGRRAHRRRRLEEDAPQGDRGGRGARRRSRRHPGQRGRGGARLPEVARRGQLHLPRLSRIRNRRRRHRVAHGGQARQRPRHPARSVGAPVRGRAPPGRPAGRGARASPGQAAPHRQQGQYALDRAPCGLSRRDRRQALRRRGPRHRRAPVRRPLHLDRLQPQPAFHPAPAPQDRARRRARQVQAQQS